MDQSNTFSNITTREKQVLRLVAREYSTVEISGLLRISVRTVETHRKNILRKINSRSLVGLTKHAIKLGLLEEFIYKPASVRKPVVKTPSSNA
ncbi:MAG: helix-turn-helix transcriptional regulator [Lentimicrobium sp.]|nr:helix-turn-helix transcriptional regulator [Lentimicrobium sp.]